MKLIVDIFSAGYRRENPPGRNSPSPSAIGWNRHRHAIEGTTATAERTLKRGRHKWEAWRD